VSRAEDIWTKLALEAAASLPLAERDQLEALVGEICRDPFGRGIEDPALPDPLGRARVATARRAVVFYEVVDEDIVRITRVFWRS
jgi:hypothetical protein